MKDMEGKKMFCPVCGRRLNPSCISKRTVKIYDCFKEEDVAHEIYRVMCSSCKQETEFLDFAEIEEQKLFS